MSSTAARFLTAIVAVAGITSLIALCAAPSFADTSSTTTTTTVTTIGPDNIPVIAMPAADPNMPTPDYMVLANDTFSHFDIIRARTLGLTRRQTAEAIGIAYLGGVKLRTVLDRVEDGMTFGTLCSYYGVSFDQASEQKYRDKLDYYDWAWHHSGDNALRDMQRNEETMAPIVETTSYSTTVTPSTTTTVTTTTAPIANATVEAGYVSSGKHEIIRTMRDAGMFGTFLRCLHETGLDKTLRSGGPYTVFAPTDAAFAKLPPGAMTTLMNNKGALLRILEYHVLPGDVTAADAMAMTSPTSPATLEGGTLQITSANNAVMVNGAHVIDADIMARNGRIHAIDSVLMPADVTVPGWSQITTGNLNALPVTTSTTTITTTTK